MQPYYPDFLDRCIDDAVCTVHSSVDYTVLIISTLFQTGESVQTLGKRIPGIFSCALPGHLKHNSIFINIINKGFISTIEIVQYRGEKCA